jgi:hypothetical protein
VWKRVILLGLILLLWATPVIADSSTDITITASGIFITLGSPTDLILTRIDANTVHAEWIKGGGNTTILMADSEAYPIDHILMPAYSGNDTNTDISWPIDNMEIYVSAWSFNGTDYSSNYVESTTGGTNMIALANQIGSLTTMLGWAAQLAFYFFLIIGLLAISVWQKELVLYAASGAVFFFIGISLINDYSGISLAILILSSYQLFQALILALASGGKARGLSQFRGIVDTVKGWF